MRATTNLPVLMCLMVVATLSGVKASCRENELRSWIDRAKGSDRTQRAEAIRERTKLGPEMPSEALEALIQAMNVGEVFRGEEASRAFRILGADVVPRLLPALDDGQDDHHRACAAKALGVIGPTAAAAVDRLITILADENLDRSPPKKTWADDGRVRGIREEAAAALVRIAANKPDVTDALLKVLANEEDQAHVRAKCAWCLRCVRPMKDRIVTALIRAVQSKSDAEVRAQAIRALAAIGPAAKAAIEPLISVLEDKSLNPRGFKLEELTDDQSPELEELKFNSEELSRLFFAPRLREEAAGALGAMGGEATIATGSLLAVLADRNDEALVRGKCAESLGRLHPPADKVVPALVLVLRSKDDYLSYCAADALAEYSPESESAVDALLAALKLPCADVRGAAIEGIAKACPQAKRAVKPLVEAVSDPVREVRESAVRALSTFGPETAVPPLIEAFKDENEEAEQGLQRIGQPAVPALVELLRHPDPSMRARAADSLSHYDYLAAEALPVLREVCRDSNADVRCMAAQALGWVGVASPEVMDSLCEALEDKNTNVRREAASSLYCLVHQATPPATAVVSALKDTDPRTLDWLINTVYVGEMTDERILPLLRKHLDHPNRDVRESAVRALRVFGPTASAAVPRIIEVAASGSGWEKLSALQTLGEIGVSHQQAELLLAQHPRAREIQNDDFEQCQIAAALLHVLVPHPSLAERHLSQHPDVIRHLSVATSELLRRQQGDEFTKLQRAVFDHPDLPAEVILEFQDPRYIPTLKKQMEQAHPHRRSYLAAVARVLGDPPDRIVKISETEPGDFRPDTSGRWGSALEGHADGFTRVLVTGRILLVDGTPAPTPRFFEGNDRMLLGKLRREPRPVEYNPETGRFVFKTTVFAATSLSSEGKLGPYMTGPAVVIIEADGCKPLNVVFYDEMPDVEITLTRQADST